MDKPWLPYLLDGALNNENLDTFKTSLVDQKLELIGKQIFESMRGDIDHLMSEKKKWNEYDRNFPIVVNKLKQVLGKQLDIALIDEKISEIIMDIQKHLQSDE